MSGTKSSQFFWSDWDSDPALQQCSLAAQGLWMRMLCICARADPHGYLAVNGRPLDAEGVANAVRKPVNEITTLIGELEYWGVYSRDRKGRIYSRRMIRDAQRAETGRKSARKRWAQPTESTGENPLPNGSAWKEPDPKTVEPEPIEASQPSSEPREQDPGGAGLGKQCDDLRNRLCEAAGWQAQRANGRLEVVGPIQALLDAGANLELDVLPVVKAVAPKCRSPNWKFFIGPIQDAMAARLRAGADVRAPPGNVIRMPGCRPSASLRQRLAFDEVFDEPYSDRSDETCLAGAVPRIPGPGTGGQ